MKYRKFLDSYFGKAWSAPEPVNGDKAPEKTNKLMEEVDLVLEFYEETSGEEFNAEADWEKLLLRIKSDEALKSRRPLNHGVDHEEKEDEKEILYRNPGHRKSSPLHWVLKIAAAFLVIALSGIVTVNHYYAEKQAALETVFREVSVDKGERANIVMSDGTKVTLNAGSRIRLPEHFSIDKREVFLLEGEVFFDVQSDPKRPFLIHSGGAVVRVLGTSFSVRSYPEDDAVRVVVEEGTVALGPEENQDSGLLLTSMQMGRFDLNSGRLTSEDINDMDLFLSWREGYLKFRDTPLREVARQLERRYNLEIAFNDPGLEELRFTAELKSRSMNNVFNVITASLGIDYTEENWKQITFTESQDQIYTP